MAINWTPEQQNVISHRNKNMLVSAAAGSGKTAVLVERIISMITDTDKDSRVDLDRMLVVTFTKAAAAEMKERIRKVLEGALAEDPGNEELRRQSVLIHNANISTIHSFCSNTIRNYFYHINIDPMFRVMDDGEGKLMKAECIHEVFEEAFAEGDEAVLDFVLAYNPGKNTQKIESDILGIYEKVSAEPWPREWIDAACERWQVPEDGNIENFGFIKQCEEECDRTLMLLKADAEKNIERAPLIGEKYVPLAQKDMDILESVLQADSFDKKGAAIRNCKFDRIPSKNAETDTKIRAEFAAARDKIKDVLGKVKESLFADDLEAIADDIKGCAPHIAALRSIILRFMEKFAEKKRSRNLMDYSDLEHFALDILITKDENGNIVRTDAAREIASGFDQIITDEYQDSNDIQELILSAVSRNEDGINNRFMVGDIKQSIYGFRNAKPELFSEKYILYRQEDLKSEVIDLSKNYRSRLQVVDTVNLVFGTLMSPSLGGVDYDKDHRLNLGADYPEDEDNDYSTELLLIDRKDPDIENEKDRIEVVETEAMMIADRIEELMGSFKVWDKDLKEMRPMRYSDCAVLLRSGKDYTEIIPKIFQNRNIPVCAASRYGYFSATEVVNVLDYLRILDNPLQDIPFAGVLMSGIGGFDSEELAKIRLQIKKGRLFTACSEYLEKGDDFALREKLQEFFLVYFSLKQKSVYYTVSTLIAEIYEQTGIRAYAAALPSGEQRAANLDMLQAKALDYEKTSFKGLFNFIRYIEELKESKEDFGEASLASEGMDAVRIMTIHKSKGLEFPVVFLSAMGKRFNTSDTRGSILIHKELGIGVDRIDVKDSKKKKTFFKKMLQKRIKEDNISEELRVLYVAMTRAKEKLIMTMVSPDLEGDVEKCLKDNGMQDGKMTEGYALSAAGFSGLVLPVLRDHTCFKDLTDWAGKTEDRTEKDLIPCDFIKIGVKAVDTLIRTEEEKQKELGANLQLLPEKGETRVYDPELNDLLADISSFEYAHLSAVSVPEKVSVSDIKKMHFSADDEQAGTDMSEAEDEIVPYVPRFIKNEETELTGSSRGTAYHKFWKYMDYEAFSKADKGNIPEFIQTSVQKMREANHLEKNEADSIRIKDMEAFLTSDIAGRMCAAALRGELHREEPFVMSIEAKRVDEDWSDEESVLVQGIIDAYFYEEDEIVLLDYKTDRVRGEDELLERYSMQLQMYREALIKNTGKNVKEITIYSTALDKCVII